jgi:hypothetical protein
MVKAGAITLTILAVLSGAVEAHAGGLHVPPLALQGMDLLYAGRTDQALADFRQIETAQPDNPLGYLLQAEAEWWQIYCESCEIRWNMIAAWHRPRQPSDEAYVDLIDTAIGLAEAHIAKSDSAEMELYAGIGWGLRGRLMGLFDDHRATARAGVNGRARLLRCLQLDPDMADAYTGLGLYSYYVDALSGLAKILRVFMGIPGGNKREGVRELNIAMEKGVLTRVGARFALADSLRIYDHDYFGSIEVLTPLATEYPQNPVFQLVLGDDQAKLAHWQTAVSILRAAEQLPADSACAERLRSVVDQAIASYPKGQTAVSN